MNRLKCKSTIDHQESQSPGRECRTSLLKHYQKLFMATSPHKKTIAAHVCDESEHHPLADDEVSGGEGHCDSLQDEEEEEEEAESEEKEAESEEAEYDEFGVFKGSIGGHTFIDQKPQARKRAAIQAFCSSEHPSNRKQMS